MKLALALLAVDRAGIAGDEDGHTVLAVDYAGNPFQTLSGSPDIFTQLSKFNSHNLLQIRVNKRITYNYLFKKLKIILFLGN